METSHRIPLHDLPLEQFLIPGAISIGKTPRRHKRPLSPDRIPPLNPAKRRVLDTEGILLSNNVTRSSHSHPSILSHMHSVTPTRPSLLGNGLIQNHRHSQETWSPLSSHRQSHSRELYAKPTIESSTDPQSRHYPGFDIFRDNEHRWDIPTPRLTVPSDGDAPDDRSGEDKENVPLRRKAKKFSSRKRFSSGLDSSDASCFITFSQTSRVAVHPERTPFSTRQPLR